MAKQILFSEESRRSMLRGVDKLANAVKGCNSIAATSRLT
jgi:hypothetical protein